jgi:hypothetical protein
MNLKVEAAPEPMRTVAGAIVGSVHAVRTAFSNTPVNTPDALSVPVAAAEGKYEADSDSTKVAGVDLASRHVFAATTA